MLLNMVYNNIYYDIVEESKIRTPNVYYPLVFSSSFFISPIISAISKQLWHFVLLATLTTFFSINHWRDVRIGPRRTIDLLFAKLSFCIYCVSGFIYIKKGLIWDISIINTLFMISFYMISNSIRNANFNNKLWVASHFIFHMHVAIQQNIVVSSIKN